MSIGTRRKFLGTAAVAAISGGAAGCGGSGRTLRFFSEQECRTMEALLDWIIPADDSPGAREAGVIHYIDRQLMREFREHRKTYREGLAAVNRLGGSLTDVQRDPATRTFFELVVTHAMQGFYSDPRHGGNRDFVSWRMLGLPPVQVRGRDRRESGAGGGNAKG
jgi:gluconate 2-dehydrogenase gamma chain